jgi:hypothetical protein
VPEPVGAALVLLAIGVLTGAGRRKAAHITRHVPRRTTGPAVAVLLSLALATPARAADPASINRLDTPPCTLLVGGPGATVARDCQLNGNNDIRSWGEAGNAAGVLRGLSGAEVAFEAIERSASSESRWSDSLVWLGGAVPAQVVFEGMLLGGFAIDIARGTISPPGVEQGRLTAQLLLLANTGGTPVLASSTASLSRDSANGTGGQWTETVSQPVTLSLDWTPTAPGAALSFEQRLITTATATNAWFRQGGGTVNAQADFLRGSGLAGVRWLDDSGADLGSAVQWTWAYGPAPVPEPGTPLLWLGGLATLALWARWRHGAAA